MANYYFLGTRLPSLKVTLRPEITFFELDILLKDNLYARDYQKTLAIRHFIDIQNIRSYWLKEELNPYGTMDSNELEEALLTEERFPRYVFYFLEKFEKLPDRLRHFPELLVTYFGEESSKAHGFLKELLLFEREWRLVMVGFRAKKLDRDILREMQFEDPDDPIVQQIIAQKDSESYVPPEKYRELKQVFDRYYEEPLALNLALSEYRFDKIDKMLGFDLFSIDRIIGYLVQLIIVESWQRLDKQKGIEIVDIMMKDAK